MCLHLLCKPRSVDLIIMVGAGWATGRNIAHRGAVEGSSLAATSLHLTESMHDESARPRGVGG